MGRTVFSGLFLPLGKKKIGKYQKYLICLLIYPFTFFSFLFHAILYHSDFLKSMWQFVIQEYSFHGLFTFEHTHTKQQKVCTFILIYFYSYRKFIHFLLVTLCHSNLFPCMTICHTIYFLAHLYYLLVVYFFCFILFLSCFFFFFFGGGLFPFSAMKEYSNFKVSIMKVSD